MGWSGCAEDCAEVDRNGSTMLRLSSVLQHRTIRCGIPSMPAIASSAMPPTDALLSQMHTLSTFAGPWTSTQHGGRDVSIKYGSKALSTSAGESRTPAVVHEGMAHKASQQLATRLRQEIRKGDSHAAWELFNAAKATGAADVLHWSMMLQLRDTSAERRIMMEEMMEAGLEFTDMTYRMLVGQLILEGNLKEAQVVVGTEMPAVGIVPSKLIESLFKLSPGRSSKMRTDHLQKLIKTNAREKAQTFFEGLKVNGVANAHQWNLMQPMCETSAEQRSMMGGMTEAGVNSDCATYNMLTTKLMFEGRLDEARAVVETEMPAAGIEPDNRTHALLRGLRRSGVECEWG